MKTPLSRLWAKGRDLYDLVWYLADRTRPALNLKILNAALAQSGWTGPVMMAAVWCREVWHKIKDLDWKRVRADARPFLERDRDIDLVTADALGGLLQEH